VVELLRSFGLRGADTLASLPAVSIGLVNRVTDEVGKANPGKLFNSIKDAAAKVVNEDEQRKQREAQRAEQAQQREREKVELAEQRQREQADHDRIAGLDDDRLTELRDRHTQTLPKFLQHRDRVPSLDDLRREDGGLSVRSYWKAIAKMVEDNSRQDQPVIGEEDITPLVGGVNQPACRNHPLTYGKDGLQL